MAGNTKLMGFDPNGKSVDLERWGGKVKIDIGQDAVSKLRAACYQILPKKPVQRPIGSSDGLDVDYDRDHGKVVIGLSPERAEKLVRVLDYFQEEWTGVEDVSDVLQFHDEIKAAHQEHVDYINTENEPGVE